MTDQTHAPPGDDAERLVSLIRNEREALNALLEEVRKIDVVNIALYAQARLKQIRETFEREVGTYMAAEHAALVADGDRQHRAIADLLDRATRLTRDAQETTDRLARIHAELPQLAAAAENLRTDLAETNRAAQATIEGLHRERTGLEAIHRRVVEELLAHAEAAEDRVDTRIRGWLELAQSRARAAFAMFVLLCCATVGLAWLLSRHSVEPLPANPGSTAIIASLPDGEPPPTSLSRTEAEQLTHPDAQGERRAYILARGEQYVGLALRSPEHVHVYALQDDAYVFRGSIARAIRSPNDLVRAYPEFAPMLR